MELSDKSSTIYCFHYIWKIRLIVYKHYFKANILFLAAATPLRPLLRNTYNRSSTFTFHCILVLHFIFKSRQFLIFMTFRAIRCSHTLQKYGTRKSWGKPSSSANYPNKTVSDRDVQTSKRCYIKFNVTSIWRHIKFLFLYLYLTSV